MTRQNPLNQELYFAAGRFLAKNSGLDDLGVIEYQEVTCLHLFGQIPKDPISWHGASTIKHLRAAAFRSWLLCNQFREKLKIKVTQTEAAFGFAVFKTGFNWGHVLEGRTRPVPS